MPQEDADPTLVLLSNKPLFHLSGHTNSAHQVSHVGPYRVITYIKGGV